MPTYYETSSIPITPIETYILSTWSISSKFPYTVSFKDALLTLVNTYSSQQAKVHTLIERAYMSPVSIVIKNKREDLENRDKTPLGYSVSASNVIKALSPYLNYLPFAIGELKISENLRNLLLSYVEDKSPVTVLSLTATTIVLAAVLNNV